MKRYIILFITAILLLSLASCNDTETVVTEQPEVAPAVDTSEKFLGLPLMEYDEYMKIYADSDEIYKNVIDKLYFNGVPVAEDSEDKTYYIPVSGGEWDNGVVTYDCADEGMKVSFVKLKLFNGSDMEKAVSEGRKFVMVAYNGTSYSTSKIVFTGLPIMTITNKVAVRDSDYPIRSGDTEAFMTLYDREGNYSESDILIHVRGGSSRSFIKNGYKMNLVDEDGEKNSLNLLGIRKDDDWVLNAVYSDESKIRDKLSYDLWGEIGARNNDWDIYCGPQMEYIELILNGRYWGIYGLVVPIDKKQLNLGENNGKTDILVKSESWEIPSFDELVNAGSATEVKSVVVKYPDVMSRNEWFPIAQFTKTFFNTDKQELEDAASTMLDIDNILDYWIFINVISGEDNAWKNMHIVFKHDGTRYVAQMMPWDCDLSWGVTWNGDAALLWKYVFYLSEQILEYDLGNNIIAKDVGGAVAKLKARWNELRGGLLSDESISERIDALTDTVKLSGAWKREIERWKYGGHSDEGSEYVKKFAYAKLAYLDGYIRGLK